MWDWVTRIRNACEQSNKDFRQELINKSELRVQNFIKGLGADISDDKIMKRILGFFSCYVNNDVQKRGTSFPIFFPDSKDPETIWDSLMDTGATRSCMNYNMFMKLGNGNLRQQGTPTVTAADGGNLGAIGITTCKIHLGTEMIRQDFIVSTYLKRNLV